MDTVIGKIEKNLVDILSEKIRPVLLIINSEDERALFTEGTIPKAISAEQFFMDKYKVEMFMTTCDKYTEPTFYGNTTIGDFHA